MKKKNGFTLTELLVTIVVLGIIMAIAALSFNSVRKNVKEKERENVYKKIQIAAEKYFADYSAATEVMVKELVEEGYLKADNSISSNNTIVDNTSGESETTNASTNYIIDPVDDTVLDCLIVDKNIEFSKEANKSETCEINSNNDLEICIDEKCQPIPIKWVNLNNCKDVFNNKCSYENIYLRYTLQENEKDSDASYYWENQYDPVDNPTTNGTALPEDGKIIKYITENIENNYIDRNYSLKINYNNKTIEKKGTLKIDLEKPTCNSDELWTKDDKEITVKCIDNGSGCKEKEFKYASNISNGQVSEPQNKTIEDNAGNDATCTYDVKVDKSAPMVAIEENSINKDTTNMIITLKYNASDTGSGVKYVCISNSSNCNIWQIINTNDKTISYNYSGITLTNVPLTLYLFVKDAVGNISDATVVNTGLVKVEEEEEKCDFDYQEFNYTGDIQTFEVPCSGTYKLDVWGAQGGSVINQTGGYGGYSTGSVYLEKGEILYVVVGGQGVAKNSNSSSCEEGYNGGGLSKCSGYSNGTCASGGGATHIAIKSGVLSDLSSSKESVLIVAGGGGGSARERNINNSWGRNGGNAGGYKGNTGTGKNDNTGGNQTAGGYCSNGDTCKGSFGKGAGTCTASGMTVQYGGAGGGGWYGGGGNKAKGISAGGGGSGYIGNEELYNKVMYCYDCTQSTDASTKTISTTNVDSDAKENYAKIGDGAAKITFEKSKVLPKTRGFDYIGSPETYVIPRDGTYLIEAWGAQGGKGMVNGTSQNTGGYGGYSSARISLNKGDTLYIVVGGKGTNAKDQETGGAGGYNGGGTGGTDNNYDSNGKNEPGGGGGGATHIAINQGALLKDTTESNLLIVAGGGGGSSYSTTQLGGSGGGSTGLGTAIKTYLGGNNNPSSYTYTYGQGENGEKFNAGGGGGGGGYYGGLGGDASEYGGGGGSGYIKSNLNVRTMYTYSSSGTCQNEIHKSNCAKSGNGYAKITYIG